MELKQVESFINESIKLRNPSPTKIDEYAEKMGAGVVFPAIKIGYWPKSEKYGENGIVDGLNRLGAYIKAGIKEIPVESVQFKTLAEAMTFMYTENMKHGLNVTDAQRDKRICLLKQMDPGLTLEKIGKVFGLGKSSIDRILKGKQSSEGHKSAGAAKSASHNSKDPMKASAIYKAIVKLNNEFLRKRPNQFVELAGFLSPVTDESPDGEVDKEKCAEVSALIEHLSAVMKLTTN